MAILFALGFLAVVSGQADRCCMSSKWTGTMSDVREVANGMKVAADFFYDFDNKMTAIHYYRFGTTRENLNKVITDYKKDIRYDIKTNGSCTSSKINGEPMLSQCIPDDATFLGSNYIGEEATGLKYDGWSIPLGNLTLTMSFSNPGCVPIIEGVVGTIAAGHIDLVLFFNGFRTGITDPQAFHIPPSCK